MIHVLNFNVSENLEAIEKGQAGLPFRKDSDSEEEENVPSPVPIATSIACTPIKREAVTPHKVMVEEPLIDVQSASPLHQHDMDHEYVSHVCCTLSPLLVSFTFFFH